MSSSMKEPKQKRKKAVTAADVAALAGVNRSAVSVVLNGAKANTGVSATTRERILKAAAELNYVADPHAQRLAGRQARPVVAIFNPQVFAGTTLDKLLAIQRTLEAVGFDAPIYSGDGQEQVHLSSLQRIRQQRPSAVLCFTMSQFDSVLSQLEQFQREGVTVVCYDYAVDLECDQVIFDRADNTYQATKYLLNEGHRQIGFFYSGPVTHSHLEINSRYAGYVRALNEYRVTPRAQWCFSGESNEKGGSLLAEEILNLKQRPTAMCIVNETVAWTFMQQVARAGVQVPHDLSVVSHDDLPIASYTAPPLTTMSHPVWEIASAVTELVKSRLMENDAGSPRQVVLRGQLVERESVQKLLPDG